MVLSFILAIGIFMILPLVIANFFKSFITSEHVMAVLEGVIRIAIFIAYIKLVSRMEDIRRTFMYHERSINVLTVWNTDILLPWRTSGQVPKNIKGAEPALS